MEDQLNLFADEPVQEFTCRCDKTLGECVGCEAELNASEIDDFLEELDRSEEEQQRRAVILAMAHDNVRELTINIVEVIATYDRIDDDDENIFIPRPTIARDTAQQLYQKLLNIYDGLQLVRKTRPDTQPK